MKISESFFRQKKLASIFLRLSLVAMSLSGLHACRPAMPHHGRDRPLAVRVIGVQRRALRDKIGYVGTLHSRREIKVLARVAGRIAALPVREGVVARRGQTLAVIAAPEISARVSRVYAEVSRAKEDSAFLCRLAEIDRELLGAKAIPRIKMEQSRQRCITSKAALRAARASLRETKAVRGKTLERAPFDGMVLKWLAQPGENAMPGRPILLFGGESKEVRVLVQEGDIEAGIRPGTPVDVTLGPGKVFRAAVTQVAPMAAGPGRMFDVRVALPDVEGRHLRHGMSLNVAFVLHETLGATAVPSQAVARRAGKTGVFTLRNEQARWVPVTVSYGEEGWVAVRGKLTEKDMVVVGMLDELHDGMPVYPVRARMEEQ